ncbi:MAG: histidine phosphatase family protein [Candidatus Woesearchaeota archaeon]
MLTIHFIRHAESEGNVQKHLIGGQQNHLDITPKGEEQAKKLQQFLLQKRLVPNHIIVSEALRARRTAEIATNHLDIKHKIDSRIVEISNGELEGKPREEFYTPELLAQKEEQGTNWKAPGGENIQEVTRRSQEALQEILALYTEGEEQHVFWFGHGLAIRAIVWDVLNAPEMIFRSDKHNTARTVLVYDNNSWHLERFNDTQHLN